MPRDFYHGESLAGFHGIRDNPVVPLRLQYPVPAKTGTTVRISTTLVLQRANVGVPVPVQTRPRNLGKFRDSATVPCKTVKLLISQISSKPVLLWLRDPAGYFPVVSYISWCIGCSSAARRAQLEGRKSWFRILFVTFFFSKYAIFSLFFLSMLRLYALYHRYDFLKK